LESHVVPNAGTTSSCCPSRRPATPSLARRRPCPSSSAAVATLQEKVRGGKKMGFSDTKNNHQH
jgi:hypothetical protein